MALTMTDLFCGAGGSSSGAIQVPGVVVRMAANHWQLAVDTHNTNHPDTDHACADISQVDPRYFPTTDLLWASPECFTAGQMVTTGRGQVPIEDVVIGDLALTHRGRWRPVVRTQRRLADTMIVIGQGHTGIEVTPNHRFWAMASTQQWINSLRQYRRQYAKPGWLAINQAIRSEAVWSTPTRIAPLPVHEPPAMFGLDLASAWWLIGRWVGDGSLTFGRNHEVLLACGFHEADELRARLADTGTHWAESRKRTAAVFSTGDEKARDWLYKHFGHGAAEKGIPSWSLGMPHTHRRALLDGYLSADGGFTQRRVRASTVSHRLAISVRLLAEGLGHRVSMARDKRTTYSIEGRTGIARQQWILHCEPKLKELRSPEAFVEDDLAWSRVRSTLPGRKSVTVYNIEVDEDHSYVLDGIVVANCTNHSQAKGRKRASAQLNMFAPLPDEAAERSRATMWDVVRFTEYHQYKAVLVENVVDAYHWAPFTSWLMAMDSLGYGHQLVFLNSMHAQAAGLPAPQSRDRMYVVFHRTGDARPDLARWQRPRAWCPACNEVVLAIQAWKDPAKHAGRYRQQYLYRCPHTRCRNTVVESGWLPASSAIDLSLPGTRIGDRAKPLAEKTRRRIAAGIARYWAPVHLEAGGHTYDAADPKHRGFGNPNAHYREWGVDEPLKTLHAIESKALAVPVEGRDGKQARPVDTALRTQTTQLETAMVCPAGGTWNDTASPASAPMRTRTTRETDAVVMAPFIAELRGGGSTSRPTTHPLATVTAGGNHHGLITPYYGRSTASTTAAPVPTVTTVDRHALVMRNNTARGDQGQMTTPADEVLRTLTTTGHQSLLTPGALAAAEAQVDDVLFLMLEPNEVIAAMAFPSSYVVLGNRRERVRMAGNAVTPPAARDLISAVVESLGGAS